MQCQFYVYFRYTLCILQVMYTLWYSIAGRSLIGQYKCKQLCTVYNLHCSLGYRIQIQIQLQDIHIHIYRIYTDTDTDIVTGYIQIQMQLRIYSDTYTITGYTDTETVTEYIQIQIRLQDIQLQLQDIKIHYRIYTDTDTFLMTESYWVQNTELKSNNVNSMSIVFFDHSSSSRNLDNSVQ